MPANQGSDSLPTNISIAAMDQDKFLLQNLGSKGVTLLNTLCLHHQAALCKKPVILRLPGLATGTDLNSTAATTSAATTMTLTLATTTTTTATTTTTTDYSYDSYYYY